MKTLKLKHSEKSKGKVSLQNRWQQIKIKKIKKMKSDGLSIMAISKKITNKQNNYLSIHFKSCLML